MTEIFPLKVSMIVWKDHHSLDDWHEDPAELLGHCDEDPMLSVGFVTAEDDATVVLTGIVNATQTLFGQSLGILKVNIVKRADIDLGSDEGESGDPFLVVGDNTSYADLYDPPDATTST